MRYFILVFCILSFFACDLRSSESYHEEAYRLELDGKYVEAIPLLDKVIEKHPDNVNAWIDRAFARLKTSDLKGAISDYSVAIAKDPDNTMALFWRGVTKEKNEDHTGAITDFNSAIESKGGERLWLEKTENSLVETGAQYDVRMEEIRFERAISLYNTSKYNEAFSDLNFALSNNYCTDECYYLRGRMYLLSDMKEKACENLRKAHELGNKDAANIIQKSCP